MLNVGVIFSTYFLLYTPLTPAAYPDNDYPCDNMIKFIFSLITFEHFQKKSATQSHFPKITT